MSKPIPPIQKYMTGAPQSIGEEQTLEEAHKLMFEHNIRHLPVLHGGKLVGVVTQRDLALIETLKYVDAKTITIEDAMSRSVYTASPTAPLDEVASAMAEHKYGCCVVMQGAKVVGIFTMVDACRTLSLLLNDRQAS